MRRFSTLAWPAFLISGLALGLVPGLTSPSASQSGSDGPLVAACQATEITAPDSCACTVTKARAVGLKDAELASLFKDDGHTQPVSQQSYSKFWQVKSQCIADATMAKMGISPNNPLPGIPAQMRPGMPLPTGAPPAQPRSLPAPRMPAAPAPPAPQVAASPSRPSAQQAQPASISASANAPESAQAKIDQMMGHAWEYTEDNGRTHRYDFLPEGNILLYRETGGPSYLSDYSEIARISAQTRNGRPEILQRSLTSGRTSDFPVREASGDTFIYMKRYVRTGEDWPFKKVGPAVKSVPESVGKRLEDGFWKVPFDLKVDKTNPFFNQNYRLGGIASPDNRFVRSSPFMNSAQSLLLITNSDSDVVNCDHSCFFVVNAFDQRSRQARRRLIEEGGVDFIGLRPEGADGDLISRRAANVVSVRAYDGYGGWKEWRCSNRALSFSCSKSGERAAPSAALASTGALTSQLGSIAVELVGEAQCSTELMLPPKGGVPTSLAAMRAHYRTSAGSRFGTATDIAGDMNGGYKINLGERPRVLRYVSGDASGSTYAGDGVTMRLGNGGKSYTDNPAEGFRVIEVQLESNGAQESFSAIDYSVC